MLRVFEAFSGVGSQRMALRNINVPHKVVAISEIDKFAIQSYEAIHGKANNLGDISAIGVRNIPDHDLFTYSFPCQDISVAGQGYGYSEASGTRSSLLWECKRVIEGKRPKYLLLENVKNLIAKKFIADFHLWLQYLESQGYVNYWSVKNATEHTIPQNRERVFVVSILGGDQFRFPDAVPLEKRLKDLLEPEVDEKYFLSEEIQNRFTFKPKGQNIIGSTAPDFRTIGERDRVYHTEGVMHSILATDYKQPKQIIVAGSLNHYGNDQMNRVHDPEGIAPTITVKSGGGREQKILINNATKKGYLEAQDGDGIDLTFPNSKTKRGRVQPQRSNTLTLRDEYGVILDNPFRIRKLTPLETWRLMAFSDSDFWKAKNSGISDTQLYRQSGNSIVVSVLEAIFTNLFKGC